MTDGKTKTTKRSSYLWHQHSRNQHSDTHTCAIQYNAPRVATSPITLGRGGARRDGGCYSGSGHRWPLKRLEPESRAPRPRGPLVLVLTGSARGSQPAKCRTSESRLNRDLFFLNACMSTPEMHMMQLGGRAYCRPARRARTSGAKKINTSRPKTLSKSRTSGALRFSICTYRHDLLFCKRGSLSW